MNENMPQTQYYQGLTIYDPQPQVIESASATTSPDNANSSSISYAIFGVAALVLTVLCYCIFSTFASVSQEMAEEIVSRGADHPISYDFEDGIDPYTEFLDATGVEYVEG